MWPRSLDASDEAKIGESLAQADKPRLDSESDGQQLQALGRTGSCCPWLVLMLVTRGPFRGGLEGTRVARRPARKPRPRRRKCEFPATDSRNAFGPVTSAPHDVAVSSAQSSIMFPDSWGVGVLGSYASQEDT